MPKVSRHRLTSIHLSDIKADSTCITLSLPLALACEKCKPTLDVLSFTRKKRKSKDRQKIKRNRCFQYWDAHWTRGRNATEGNVILHRKIRSYLGIESDVLVDYYYYYAQSNKYETSQTISESSTTQTVSISNTNEVVSTDVDDDSIQGGRVRPVDLLLVEVRYH